MLRHIPHYPHNARVQIYKLPVGHWFFLAYDRLARTPEPAEILAERPSADFISWNFTSPLRGCWRKLSKGSLPHRGPRTRADSFDLDIQIPNNAVQVEAVVNKYRHEIMRDWIHDIFAANRLGQFRLNGDYANYDEIGAIVEDWARQNQLPYARVDNV
ncbi:hypothetical protein NliqN6_1568 [Naganishia liquefaciens]|uniref:Uncharacterized protein n=1 Tax=Naganishia liquefaciens TaxID=104408 RepID=A0A8H3YEY2_9TREE|nr:hypothetical protein NliqN6_1568 [Naganishia liquefaciens]